MRVAYLTSQYPAASHTFIRREVDALRRRGIDIRTFSIRTPPAHERGAEPDREAYQSTIYVLPVGLAALGSAHLHAMLRRPSAYLRTFALALRHRVPGLRALVWAFLYFAESIVLAGHLRRADVAHLHNHFANAGANVGLLAARFLGLPWSLTLHGISETDYPSGLLLAEKIRHADFVACASWFGRAQAMRVTPADHWHKLFVMRCGLDLAQLAGAPVQRRAPGARPRIVCVGRLSAEKGHIGLLEAFAGLRRKVDAELVLVGDGPERESIERRCAALGLTTATLFRGRLAEAETLAEVATADLLVLPSFMEGLPVALMEAMAIGVPVVAPHVAGIPELIEDDRTGLLFRPSDWAHLEENMTRLLTDDAARARLVEAARDKVTGEFAIDAAVEPLVERWASTARLSRASAEAEPELTSSGVAVGLRRTWPK